MASEEKENLETLIGKLKQLKKLAPYLYVNLSSKVDGYKSEEAQSIIEEIDYKDTTDK